MKHMYFVPIRLNRRWAAAVMSSCTNLIIFNKHGYLRVDRIGA